MDFANEEPSQNVFLILRQKNLRKMAVACTPSTRLIKETRKAKRTISSRKTFTHNIKKCKRRKKKQRFGEYAKQETSMKQVTFYGEICCHHLRGRRIY
jgi:hypothetical protein